MIAETLAPEGSILPLSQALLLPRIAIESTMPVIDNGEFAVKAVVGQRVNVTSKVFADGHDKLAVLIRWRVLEEESWHSVVMTDVGNDGWEGAFTVAQLGPHEYCIEAWIDTFASFCYELRKKHEAGVPVSLELQEGRSLVLQAAERSDNELRDRLMVLHHELSGLLETEQVALFLHEDSAHLMTQADHRAYLSVSPAYPIDVERRTICQLVRAVSPLDHRRSGAARHL